MTSSASAAAGAVLSRDEIEDRHAQLIPSGFDADSLKPAAYDLRAAPDGLITPDGRRYSKGAPYPGILIVEPGQTAFVTTAEEFALPDDIAGNIFIKGDLARRGVVLLTGLVVDPGYGSVKKPEPLHFYLANLGREPVAIEPGHTKIVTIQFLRVNKPTRTPVRPIESSFAHVLDREDEAPGSVLGFIKDMTEVKEGHRSLVARFQEQDRLNQFLIVGAAFVFAVTVLGVALSSLLTLASDKKAIDAANAVAPNTNSGKLFASAVVLGIAWVIYSLTRLVPLRKQPHRASKETERDLWRVEAIQNLRVDRAVRLAIFCAGTVVALSIAVWAVIEWHDQVKWWPLWVLGGALLAIVLSVVFHKLWRPITADAVNEETVDVTFVRPANVLQQIRAQSGQIQSQAEEIQSLRGQMAALAANIEQLSAPPPSGNS